jgi:ATP-dependent RNA helicase MSS116
MAAEVSEEEPEALLNVDKKVAKPEITNEYASLKPYVNYDMWSALVNKPFNFKEMSVVQERVLGLLPDLADPMQPPMPDGEGRDMLVKAKTGTGKTIAFLVPALERRIRAINNLSKGIVTEPFRRMVEKARPDTDFNALDKHGKARLARQFGFNTAGVLVISPTRELATQIANEAQKLCTHHKDLDIQLLVGGASRVQQLRNWSKGRADIVVATPGRIIDLLESESVVRGPMSGLQTLIYDEADTLLDMGFRADIEKIVSFLPKASDRSTMLFSATVSKDVREIARQSLLPDHRFIDCVPKGEDNLHMHVPQNYTVIKSAEDQFAHLARLIALDQLRHPGKSKVIVFCPTRSVTSLFASRFNKIEARNGKPSLLNQLPCGERTNVYELHSAIDSHKRFRISDNFRQDKTGASILFTSDVSARGVDYPGTTHVIQIGIPSSADIYVHRVGRTGRAGASGRADLLLQPFEENFIRLELGKLPIKMVDAETVQGEVIEMAKKFDEDPASIIPEDIMKKMQNGDRRSVRGESFGLTRFRGPLTEKLDEGVLNNISSQAATESAKESVEDCFTSMLGYYASRSRELKSPIKVICEDLKTWAVSAGDLERPPYVSDSFLAKLGSGYKEDSRQRFSGRGKPSGRFDSPRRSDDRGSSARFGRDRGGSERYQSSRGSYQSDRGSPRSTERQERFY